MAKKSAKTNPMARFFCVIMALLIIAACTIGGLQLWGKGNVKPSEWFKKNEELAPVTITLSDGEELPAVCAATQAMSAEGYPSTKLATARCTLPEGGSPDRYEWEIKGGTGLSVKASNASGSRANVTAQTYFAGKATLTARAYLADELRGIGSIGITAINPNLIEIAVYYLPDAETHEYQEMLSALRAYDAEAQNFSITFREYTSMYECVSQEADYAIFFDENNRIAEFDEFALMSDAGIPVFYYNTGDGNGVDEGNIEGIITKETIEEGEASGEMGNTISRWAEEDELGFASDLNTADEDILSQYFDWESAQKYPVAEYDGWENLFMDFGDTINGIALSSSESLQEVKDVMDMSGLYYPDFKYIILDVKEADAELLREIIAEGAEVLAYTNKNDFAPLFEAINKLESGETINDKTIYVSTIEAFV